MISENMKWPSIVHQTTNMSWFKPGLWGVMLEIPKVNINLSEYTLRHHMN